MTIRLKDLGALKGVDLQGRQKRSRFKVVEKSRRTMDGTVFASLSEMNRYAALKLRQRAGEIGEIELQPAFKVAIPGPDGVVRHYCTYTADFRYVELATGRTIVEESKTSGTIRDAAYKLRKRAAELYYGLHVDEVVAR
jgi:hypothetical protein